MKTISTITLTNAKVVKSRNRDNVVQEGKTKDGQSYSYFSVADIDNGAIYTVYCFEALAKQAVNMKLVAGEDTVSLQGSFEIVPKRDAEGKIIAQVNRIKPFYLTYGVKLKKDEPKELKEQAALDKSDPFANGQIPPGRPFR